MSLGHATRRETGSCARRWRCTTRRACLRRPLATWPAEPASARPRCSPIPERRGARHRLRGACRTIWQRLMLTKLSSDVNSRIQRRNTLSAISRSRAACATATPRSVTNLTTSILNSRRNFLLFLSTLQFLGHDLIFVSTKPAAALDAARATWVLHSVAPPQMHIKSLEGWMRCLGCGQRDDIARSVWRAIPPVREVEDL